MRLNFAPKIFVSRGGVRGHAFADIDGLCLRVRANFLANCLVDHAKPQKEVTHCNHVEALTGEYWVRYKKGAEAIAKQFAGPSAETEVDKQIDITENLLTHRVGAIGVSPCDGKALVRWSATVINCARNGHKIAPPEDYPCRMKGTASSFTLFLNLTCCEPSSPCPHGSLHPNACSSGGVLSHTIASQVCNFLPHAEQKLAPGKLRCPQKRQKSTCPCEADGAGLRRCPCKNRRFAHARHCSGLSVLGTAAFSSSRKAVPHSVSKRRVSLPVSTW